eukprot:488825-Pyramimonas_sp.AAC.1
MRASACAGRSSSLSMWPMRSLPSLAVARQAVITAPCPRLMPSRCRTTTREAPGAASASTCTP